MPSDRKINANRENAKKAQVLDRRRGDGRFAAMHFAMV